MKVSALNLPVFIGHFEGWNNFTFFQNWLQEEIPYNLLAHFKNNGFFTAKLKTKTKLTLKNKWFAKPIYIVILVDLLTINF